MPSDVRTLVNGFAKNPLKTRREGLYFKEKDYKCVRADDYSLYAKNVSVQDVKTTGKHWCDCCEDPSVSSGGNLL